MTTQTDIIFMLLWHFGQKGALLFTNPLCRLTLSTQQQVNAYKTLKYISRSQEGANYKRVKVKGHDV